MRYKIYATQENNPYDLISAFLSTSTLEGVLPAKYDIFVFFVTSSEHLLALEKRSENLKNLIQMCYPYFT